MCQPDAEIEITEAMVVAGFYEFFMHEDGADNGTETVRAIYRAMVRAKLKAAPATPEGS